MSDNDLQPQDETQSAPMEEFDESAVEETPEPRKPMINPNTLLLLGLLGAVGAATYVMCVKASAQTIRTDPSVLAAATQINAFLKGGEEERYQLAKIQLDTEKIVAEFNNYPLVHQVPLSELHGNPFRDPEDDKPVSLKEDVRQQQEELRQKAAEAAAKGLKLQSIVYSTHSLCMINGRPYAVGQGNETFTVESIEQNGVWVRLGTLRMELMMTQPKAE